MPPNPGPQTSGPFKMNPRGPTTRQPVRNPVHIVWDVENVGVPTEVSEVWLRRCHDSTLFAQVYVVNTLLSLVEKECQGYVESFVCFCKEGTVPFKTKRDLQGAQRLIA